MYISGYDTSQKLRDYIHGTDANGKPYCKPLDGSYEELPAQGK